MNSPKNDQLVCAPAFRRVAILGAGLIGGSIAHALRLSEACGQVIAYDADARNAGDALARGLVDQLAGSVAEAVRDADAVVVAVPVGLGAPVLAQAVEHLAPHAVVVDTGSVKGPFALACQALPAALARRIVPCHPIAGHVASGPRHAAAGLMHGRLMIMTPLRETDAGVYARVRALWAAIGFEVLEMSPAEHDAVYASLSHMPHVASFALMHYLAEIPLAGEQLLRLGGNAIKDMTRCAGANPRMWSDILTANRQEVLRALAGFRRSLDRMEASITHGDTRALEGWLQQVGAARPAGWDERAGR